MEEARACLQTMAEPRGVFSAKHLIIKEYLTAIDKAGDPQGTTVLTSDSHEKAYLNLTKSLFRRPANPELTQKGTELHGTGTSGRGSAHLNRVQQTTQSESKAPYCMLRLVF